MRGTGTHRHNSLILGDPLGELHVPIGVHPARFTPQTSQTLHNAYVSEGQAQITLSLTSDVDLPDVGGLDDWLIFGCCIHAIKHVRSPGDVPTT